LPFTTYASNGSNAMNYLPRLDRIVQDHPGRNTIKGRRWASKSSSTYSRVTSSLRTTSLSYFGNAETSFVIGPFLTIELHNLRVMNTFLIQFPSGICLLILFQVLEDLGWTPHVTDGCHGLIWGAARPNPHCLIHCSHSPSISLGDQDNQP